VVGVCGTIDGDEFTTAVGEGVGFSLVAITGCTTGVGVDPQAAKNRAKNISTLYTAFVHTHYRLFSIRKELDFSISA
jgi:hypothetical protein